MTLQAFTPSCVLLRSQRLRLASQPVPHIPDLLVRRLERSRRIDDEVGASLLLVDRHLRINATLSVFDRELVPRRETLELQGRRAGGDDDAVEVLVASGFVEQRN